MKNKLILTLAFVASFTGLQAGRDLTPAEKQAIQSATCVGLNVGAVAVYSTQIGIAQAASSTARLTGLKDLEKQYSDREKRLQFCLWETQNLIHEMSKAKTEEDKNAVATKFAEQMSVCNKLVSSVW